jgi:hypothetical protein
MSDLLEQVILEARIKLVKVRVRGGKVERRKKTSNVSGSKIKSGKLVRMTPAERIKRKRGARKAAMKSKSKRARALLKRKRSLAKRKAAGG